MKGSNKKIVVYPNSLPIWSTKQGGGAPKISSEMEMSSGFTDFKQFDRKHRDTPKGADD